LTEKRLDFLLDLSLCLFGGGSSFRSSGIGSILGRGVLLAFGRGLFLRLALVVEDVDLRVSA
jgi:hypothetical protein